jgi:signal transduction histidine kinase
MRKGWLYGIALSLFFSSISPLLSVAQEPDLSKIPDPNQKIGALLGYCEALRLNTERKANNYPMLQKTALEGITITPSSDEKDRARFFYYAAIGCYYQVKFDSAQFYFYQSLYESQAAKMTDYIVTDCVALIPVNFQLRQQNKVDSCKNVLQAILDTTHNKQSLQDGYSALGSYYQQKAYYNTAEDYFLKSITLRKERVDTTTDVKQKADYAIQCYLLSKQYGNTGVPEKSLNILREGYPFSAFSPVVGIRYLSSLTEVHAVLGNIDSALYYETLLENSTKGSRVVPSELVSANLNIAKYYIEHHQLNKAFPYVTKAKALADSSKSPLLIYQSQIWNGRYLQETGKYTQAIAQLALALPAAKQFSKEQYAEALKYMALAEKGAGNADEAINYYEQFVQQDDSLNKEKISQNLADQETRYETNQKQLRIVSLSKENQLELLEIQSVTRTKLFLILGLFAAGIIALLLYFIYRNKEKTNQVLNERNSQLDQLNQQLAVANNTKTKLFGIIGHDLRAPISQVVQFLQIQKEMGSSMSPETRQSHEKKLHAASENVLGTMEDLLLWSKSQMQHFTPQIRSIDIAGIVEKELAGLTQRADDKKIKLSPQIHAPFIQKTDENFATVVIRNLLQNAIKYSDDGSTVSVSSDPGNLYISNQCSSMKAEKLNGILIDKSVSSESSGLGLQIANDLAVASNMKIHFRQEENNIITSVVSWQAS